MNEEDQYASQPLNVNYGTVLGDLFQIGYATIQVSSSVERHEPHELLSDTPNFVGRVAAMDELDGMLASRTRDSPNVIEFWGMGGVGKTTTAIHWSNHAAQEFQDGQIYLDLNGYGPGEPVEPLAALGALLRSLGVDELDISDSVEECSKRLRTVLSNRAMLIILDNAASVDQVRPLLPGSSQNFVIITSRDRLDGLAIRNGAKLIHLDVFTPSESAKLLYRLLPDQEHDEHQLIEELSELCGHLPLALLIAAQAISSQPHVGTADLVAELKGTDHGKLDYFGVTSDPRTALRPVLSWSYNSLTDYDARIFRIIASLPMRGIDAHAVAAAMNCDLRTARTTISELYSRSLVDMLGIDRVRMHDLMREYGGELSMQHDSSNERAAVVTRLVDYYMGATTSAIGSAFPTELERLPYLPIASARTFQDSKDAKRWLDAELSNLSLVVSASIDSGRLEATIQLSVILHPYLYGSAHCAEAMAIHEFALEAAERLNDSTSIIRVMKNIGTVQWRLGRLRAAQNWYSRALALMGQIDNTRIIADIYNNLGNVNDRLGDYHAALNAHKNALELRESLGDREAQGASNNNIGLVYWRLGETGQALECFERALALALETKDSWGEGDARCNLGILYAKLGRRKEAIEAYETAAQLSSELDDPAGESIALCNLGNLLRRSGDYAEAVSRYERALYICENVHDLANSAMVKSGLGTAYAYLGDRGQCMRYLIEALAESREAGDRANEGETFIAFGSAYSVFGESRLAMEHFEQALAVGRALKEKDIVCEALNGVGHSLLKSGDLGARERFTEALDIACDTDNLLEHASALIGLSGCYELEEDLPQACGLARQVAVLFEQIQSSQAEVARERVTSLQERLGEP